MRSLADCSAEGNLLMQEAWCTTCDQPLAAGVACCGNGGEQVGSVVGVKPSASRSVPVVAGCTPRSHRPCCVSSHHVERPTGCASRWQQASCLDRVSIDRSTEGLSRHDVLWGVLPVSHDFVRITPGEPATPHAVFDEL